MGGGRNRRRDGWWISEGEGGAGRTHVDFSGILSVFTELFIKSLIDIHDYQEKRALAHP